MLRSAVSVDAFSGRSVRFWRNVPKTRLTKIGVGAGPVCVQQHGELVDRRDTGGDQAAAGAHHGTQSLGVPGHRYHGAVDSTGRRGHASPCGRADNGGVRISAKTDYAIRAALEMAARSRDAELVKADAVAEAQRIPLRFLLSILNELRHAGIVESRRGQDGGYRLAAPPDQVTVADIIRAIDGPLANVAGTRPEALELAGSALALRDVWISLRSNIRAVLERVTLADIVENSLPTAIVDLNRNPDAWTPH